MVGRHYGANDIYIRAKRPDKRETDSRDTSAKSPLAGAVRFDGVPRSPVRSFRSSINER